MNVALILLAGGKGLRMGMQTPKQFLNLQDKAVALHSLHTFDQVPEIKQKIVVVDPNYRSLFPGCSYALPGERRQDSVWNGLQLIDSSNEWVCIHDAARPFVTTAMIKELLSTVEKKRAAALATPLHCTVKEATREGSVVKTLDRSSLWEIQTPQAIQKDLLWKGFEYANNHGLTVTDDVSLVELLKHPVQLVPGSIFNIKITTSSDFELAELYASKRYGL